MLLFITRKFSSSYMNLCEESCQMIKKMSLKLERTHQLGWIGYAVV